MPSVYYLPLLLPKLATVSYARGTRGACSPSARESRRTPAMLAIAGVTAAVIIPAGIGWLTRFGDIDWQRLAARLQGRDERARDSEPLSPLPRSDLIGQRQLHLLVPRRLTIGAEGAHPPSNLSATTAALATTIAIAVAASVLAAGSPSPPSPPSPPSTPPPSSRPPPSASPPPLPSSAWHPRHLLPPPPLLPPPVLPPSTAPSLTLRRRSHHRHRLHHPHRAAALTTAFPCPPL